MGLTVFRSRLRELAAKKAGRESFYGEYSLQVCNVTRDTRFRR